MKYIERFFYDRVKELFEKDYDFFEIVDQFEKDGFDVDSIEDNLVKAYDKVKKEDNEKWMKAKRTIQLLNRKRKVRV